MTKFEIETKLRSAGIDFSKPGFYDDPAFLLMETQEPSLLEIYADYIESIDWSEEYIAHARQTILSLTAFMHHRLREDGRLGACIDTSLALSRMLEREGVWNYPVKGATSLVFEAQSGLARRSFEAILTSANEAKTGHVWLCAPPFRVVDVTIKHQQYYDHASDLIPTIILAENPERSSVELWELVESPAIDEFEKEHARQPTLDDYPDVMESIRKFGSYRIYTPAVNLNYIFIGVFPSDGPLEQETDLCLSGKHRAKLYDEYKEQVATV
jgi:hypothetical protein